MDLSLTTRSCLMGTFLQEASDSTTAMMNMIFLMVCVERKNKRRVANWGTSTVIAVVIFLKQNDMPKHVRDGGHDG